MRLPTLNLIIIGSLLLAACAPTASAPTTPKLHVVATHSILGDMVQNVGGEVIELKTLVGPDGDAHTFEPSPTDSLTLKNAAVIFENGLGFENWLDELYAASNSQATRVVVSEGLGSLTLVEAGETETDPHIWHSVTNALMMVKHIRDGLIAADPLNRVTYTHNAEVYLATLTLLDASLREKINTLPSERRKLVTTHDTFGYFAREYGFEIVGTALGSFSTESGDPSAGDLAALVRDIKAAGVPVIFVENIANPGLMERLANEAGVTLAPTLYTDALGPAGSPGATYVELMRYNVDTIVNALNK